VTSAATTPAQDAEFQHELRRIAIMLCRAIMRRYGLSWADLLPRDVAVLPAGWIDREAGIAVGVERG
jgi:hypothetical protein